MDTLIKWAIYGAICVAVLATVTLAWHSFVIAPAMARGAAQQAAKDAPIIAGLTKQRDQAIAANKTLGAQVEALQGQFAEVHAALDAAQTASQLATAHAAAALAAAVSRTREDAAQILALRNIVNAEDHETQIQACADARALLADLAIWRRSVLN